MKDVIKGISAILWLLIIGPIAVYGLKEVTGLILAIAIYFGVLFLLVYWTEK